MQDAAQVSGAGQGRLGEVSPGRAFGAVLARHRARAGLSQRALALESGISHTHVAALEKGAREPTLGTLLHLARALGSPPAELFGEVIALLGAR